MATRREQRKNVTLSVRIFGMDANGRVFSEILSTVNVSLEGAMLTGFKRPIKTGEVIGLSYGKSKARFRVQWVGQPGTPLEGRIGVQNLLPTTCIWDVQLPPRGAEEKSRVYATARKFPRIKCSPSVELRPNGLPPLWSKAGEMSPGGCFVEMMMPLQPGTRMKISIWLKDDKVVAEGVVANSRPGHGIGIKFTEMNADDMERLKDFLKTMVRIPLQNLGLGQAGHP
jgi:hypothetical protein